MTSDDWDYEPIPEPVIWTDDAEVSDMPWADQLLNE
jgi:hypothetical protein